MGVSLDLTLAAYCLTLAVMAFAIRFEQCEDFIF